MEKERILTIDIGGSSIKATVLNTEGEMLVDYIKTPTPENASPDKVIKEIKKLVADFPSYDKISVGFPGYVKNGIVYTAPNLGTKAWKDFKLAQVIANTFNKPVRLLNDADLQGFALIKGKGLEMIITLGTGFGTALFANGDSFPHLELAHLPIRKGKDYDDYIGDAALKKEGDEKWNKKVKEVLRIFKTVVNYDTLYLSGGNSKRINFKLDDNIQITGNRDGIKGGALLWKNKDDFSLQTIFPEK
jgi:polyphosphate glucokinase